MPRKVSSILLVALVFAVFSSITSAQVSYDPNAEQFQLLSLNQAYINLGKSARDFIRARDLFQKGHYSQQQYDNALSMYRNSKIQYDMAMMRILTNASYVIVEKAVKRTNTETGVPVVDITIKNVQGGSFELAKLNAFGARKTSMSGGNWDTTGEPAELSSSATEEIQNYEEAITTTLPFLEGQGLAFEDVLNLLEVTNIFVSLYSRDENNQTVMISSPYEVRVPRLGQGEKAKVSFELLRDVESLTVELRFGDKSIQKPVYLRLESTEGGIQVDSQIPSVQADLDSTASFNLSLQRFSSGSTTFSLRVVGLPEQIDYNYVDSDNNNQQVTRVNFTEGTVRKNLQLQLTMPTRSDDDVVVDQPIPFKAVVLNAEEVRKFDELRREFGRNIPDEKLAELNAGMVDLTVTPLGVGRVEVSASTFYYPIMPDEQVDMTITVKNTGTGELKNVEIDADPPNNEWNYTIEPSLIRSLQPEEQQNVKITFLPPEDTTVGTHILKVKVEAKTRNRIIEADDKEVTVDIKEKPDIWGRLILIVLLIGIVLGIVIFGIKLSRR